MSRKLLGCMIIIISVIIPVIIIFNSEILSPKLNIIGVDGIVASKAIMIMGICLILSKVGFYFLSNK